MQSYRIPQPTVRRAGLFAAVLLQLFLTIVLAYASNAVAGRVLRVGPGKPFALPSDAARVAADGDTVEIAAGDYFGDAAIWRANRLVIRGIGGMARLHAAGASAESKAIWVIKGNDTRIENVGFSGARVPDRNGAGIRLEGAGLVVRASAFIGNEMGILTGRNPHSEVVLEGSEFANNGSSGRHNHNVYVGEIRRLTVRHCYIHNARIGHNIKTRAAETVILYSRIGDASNGFGSYEVEFPNGGVAILVGNIIEQGALTQNRTIVSIGAEGHTHLVNALIAVNNTLINRASGQARYFHAHGKLDRVALLNNVVFGSGSIIDQPHESRGNVRLSRIDFVNFDAGDYRPKIGSAAIDAAVHPGDALGIDLQPSAEYVHPSGIRSRTRRLPFDAGALDSRRPPGSA